MKREIKRRGFTLVELLIVIVVIGILSAMMMLSSTEAVSSARASNIVSNLRNLKTAALAWYVDSLDVIEGKDDKGNAFALNDATHFKFVKRYLNNDTASDLTDYHIVEATNNNIKQWFVYYAKDKADANVRLKLQGRATSTGLLKGTANTTANKYDGTNTNIYMLVR